MVELDPVDPRLDADGIRMRAGTGFCGGVGGGRGDARRSHRWLLVSCGDGSDSKRFYRS